MSVISKILFSSIAICLIAILLSGCSAKNSSAQTSATGTNAAPPDTPASLKCTNDGGADKILYDSAGKIYSLCMFTDGSICNQDDYYQGKCNKGDCLRKCENIGTRSEGWYDCHGNLLFWDKCKGEDVLTAGTC